MRLSKLFFSVLFAVIAMTFVACKSDSPVNELPEKSYLFELTSNDVMEFPAEGGEGVIEWTLKEVTRSTADMPEPKFATEAEWIALDAQNLGAFTVAENEGEAREAKIAINYGEQTESVTVKQAAAVVETPVEATELAAAMRIPSEELDLENNVFALAFVDDTESLELGIVLVGEEGTEILAAGTYNVDNEGLVADECTLQVYSDEEFAEYFFEGGEVVVAVDGENYDFDITLTTTEGEEMLFSYSGVVVDMVPESKPTEPVAFTPVSVKAEYSMIGNFFLQLYIDDTRYHELDMLDEVAPNEDYLSAGVYSYTAETISPWSTFSTGNDQTCAFADAEITLVHNDDNTTTITGYIKSEEGDHITIDWTGVVEGMTLPNGEEPGGEEPGDELPFYNFTSAEICWWSAWSDFQIAFTDANGVVLTCDFWRCTEKNFLPEGTYWVGNSESMVYTDSYSYIDLNDGGPLQDLQGGKVIVAEVDGKYEFTFEGIYYGSLNDMDNLKQFNGKYVGTIAEMILPSEYEEPNIDELEIVELTQASWCKTYGTWGVSGEYEICWYDAENHSTTLDFTVNPIVAGTYTLEDGLKATYCKYRGAKMSDCTVVVTGSGELTFDVTFVAEVDGVLGRYHFTWTGNPATLAD